MTEPIQLGVATWGCEGNFTVHFLPNDRLAVSGRSSSLNVFDLKTGLGDKLWEDPRSDIGYFDVDGAGRYYMGNSYGIVFTIEVVAGNATVLEQRDVVSYTETVSWSETAQTLAVSSFAHLCLLPQTGTAGKVDIEFDRSKIVSADWSDSRKAFLIVTWTSIEFVTTTGERELVVAFPGRTRAAVYCEVNQRLYSVVEAPPGRISISCANIDSPQKPEWSNQFLYSEVDPSPKDNFEGTNEANLVVRHESDLIYMSTEQIVRRFSLDGQEVGPPKRLPESIRALALSPDANYLAAATSSEVLYCWNKDGMDLHPRTAHSLYVLQIVFSADDAFVYSQSMAPEVCCWNSETGERVWHRHFETDRTRGMVLLDNDRIAVSLWNKHRDHIDVSFIDSRSGNVVSTLGLGRLYDAPLLKDASGNLVVLTRGYERYAGGENNICVEIRTPSTCEVLKRFCSNDMESNYYCIHANLLAACDNHHVWLWDLSKNGSKSDFPLPDKSKVRGLCFLGETQLLLVSEQSIYTMDPAKRRWKKQASLNTEAVAISLPQANRIAVCGVEGLVEIRSTTDFSVVKPLWTGHSDGEIYSCVLSNSGTKLVIGGRNGSMTLWPLV